VRPGRRSHVRHALRVAAVATAVVAVAYAIAVGAFDLVVTGHLAAQADQRLEAALDEAVEALHRTPAGSLEPPPATIDPDDTPLTVWRVTATGRVLASQPTAPPLPRSWPRNGTLATAAVGHSVFWLRAVRAEGGWLVAGESVASRSHVMVLLETVELIAAPIVLLGIFLASFLIGVQAAAPVEEARRRQLEFTADASHELRTPLSVIEAEVDLALSRPRDQGSYQDTLNRVRSESSRLRRIVEDLLWLGRLDARPSPGAERVDLATIAEQAVERFAAVAHSRGLAIGFDRVGGADPLVVAPADWLDRLAGVLVDNACRYTPTGGQVLVRVETRGNRVGLVVDDSGPGIAPTDRDRLFDRFHRATDQPGGTGLGLAIGDAVVRSTSGQWEIGDSPLGGARLAVWWHRAHPWAGSTGGPRPTARSGTAGGGDGR
jgi:two-component system sensor histidine kinase CiaH